MSRLLSQKMRSLSTHPLLSVYDSIVELKGNEYVKRAIAYISTFIPEGKRNEMELLDFLYQLTDRDDVKEYRCELIAQAMTRE